MKWLRRLLGECGHRELCFPRARKGSDRWARRVCLECGQEFAYDWLHMRLLGPLEAQGEASGANAKKPLEATRSNVFIEMEGR